VVDVTGCGKRTSYLVDCETHATGCATGGVPKAKAAPTQLADKWQPQAIKAAQERATVDLQCPAATAEVTRSETVEEAQTTGWSEPPYRALYTVAIAGCEKAATYLVACNSKQKVCKAGSVAR
jgi:hypothetical protein